MSAHTPGPWYPIKNSAGGWEVMTLRDADFMTGEPRSFIGSKNGASICMGIGDHTESRTRGNEAENARLIAAPDLLGACIAAKSGDPRAYQLLRAAIAKAKGKQP